jgi:DNA-binding NtrC family response regulator
MENGVSAVLIVDDEPDMCWVLKNLLSERGYAIRSVQTGVAALKLLADTHFSIALLDAKLTDIDGLQLAADIKSIDPTINIIVISGYYYENDVNIQRAIQEGLVFGFIAKPFFHDDLIKMIDAVSAKQEPQ